MALRLSTPIPQKNLPIPLENLLARNSALRDSACVFGSPAGHSTPYMASDVTESVGFYKLWAWLETNRKQAAWGAVIAAVVVLGICFFVWQQGEAEVTAAEALSNAAMPQSSPDGRADSAKAYLSVAAKYPKSAAGARALLLGAGSLFVEGKYPEAQAQFERFAREHHDTPFMSQALLGIAACLDAQGK